MEKRKRGGQPGNSNAQRSQPKRVVLSVKGDILAPYYEEHQKKYGYSPPDERIKAILRASLRETRVLHLSVRVPKEHAPSVRRIIEKHLGVVRTIYFLDHWSEERNDRTIYYQRLLTGHDPDTLEPWEDRDIVTDEMIDACLKELYACAHASYINTEYSQS